MEKMAINYMMLDGKRFNYTNFNIYEGNYETTELAIDVKWFALNDEGLKFTEENGNGEKVAAVRKHIFIVEKYIDNILYIK